MKKLGLAAVHTILLTPLTLLGVATFARWNWPTSGGELTFSLSELTKGFVQMLISVYYDYSLVWPGSAIITLTTLASLGLFALQLRNHLKARA